MDPLPDSLPRASDLDGFDRDPFAFLEQAREAHGDAFVLKDGAAIFSRADDCPGVVAVFGTEFQRTVFGDAGTYGMPESAALKLGLPDNLINLNRSLHSMEGDEHARQKRFLNRVLSEANVEGYQQLIAVALDEITAGWGDSLALLEHMRELMFQVGCRVLFGDQYARREWLATLLRAYFLLRREVSGTGSGSREELAALGHSLDAELRSFVRDCRADPASSAGILGKIATLEVAPGELISEDEAVGHSNIFFVSSSEPMAVSMTWVLLVLSQLPGLRGELRDEIRSGERELLGRVIDETLRVLPPNAFMVRLTKQPTTLGGFELPAGTEVVLCPFVAHRDPDVFAQADRFLPSRWQDESPSPFEYFPFGAGGHLCVGRHAATYLIKEALAYLLPRFDLALDGDQEIDWRLHIMFMPQDDPIMSVTRTDSSAPTSDRGGKLLGPVGDLLRWDA